LRNLIPVIALVGLVLTAGCSGMSAREQRTLSGGAMGAAGGALLGGIVGGSPATGAMLGGAGGAALGFFTSDDDGYSHGQHSQRNHRRNYNRYGYD